MSLASFTRSYLITEVLRQLQQRTTTSGLFTSTDLERWVDLAVLDIASRTRCLRTEATAQSVSAQDGYTIPDDCIGGWAISRLDYSGKPLELVPWDEMGDKIPAGQSISASGTPKYWSPYGRTVRTWPRANMSGAELRVFYAKMPDSFSADSVALTDLGIPETYGPATESFMRARGYTLQGDEDRALKAYQLYLEQLGEASRKEMPDVATEATRGAG